jgi:hypothetical protein
MSVGLPRILGLALALSLAVAAPADARRDVPVGFYGMVYDNGVASAPLAVQEQQFAAMAQHGVESVRTVFSWASAQPVENGPIDLSGSDQIVGLAALHGMSILPVVIYSPPWARRDQSSPASPPADPSDYARYLQALAARYGSRGSFWNEHPELPRRPVLYWQLWNEPHLRIYWDAAHWQSGYGKLLRTASAAVRRTDARARIVLAGLTGASWDALESLYQRGHVRGSFDVAGLQTYTGTARHLLHAVHLFRAVLARHGAARMPMWLTEMGWPAAKGRTTVPVYQRTIATSDAGMAARLRAGYSTLIRERRKPNAVISRVYWYTWSSPYVPSTDVGTGIFRFAGLFAYDGQSFVTKPAANAYLRSARGHEGCKKGATGRCQ